MNTAARILIIDTDALCRRALHGDLLAAGFDVTDAEHLAEAVALCRIMNFDILLSRPAANESRAETCQTLRSANQRAALVVMMAADDDPSHTVELLDAGADQCLPATLYRPELIARLRAALRRSGNSSERSGGAIAIGGIRLEPDQRAVYRDGVPVRLTPKEFTLLHHLMTHAGLPLSHASLLEAVWGSDHIGRVEYLRIFMRQLRTKLNDHINPRYLLTDSCIGYRFVAAEEAPSTHQVGWAA